MHAPSFLCGAVEERRDGKPVPYGGRTRDDVGIVPYCKNFDFCCNFFDKKHFLLQKVGSLLY